MKHVLSIQDLSCYGRCSLTVALPVLSAMGCRCSVLPTAVLSTHTAFPDPRVVSLTEEILPFGEHWSRIGAGFDVISVGYLSSPRQSREISGVLDLFPAPVILDPVMGDGGRLYSRITPEHLSAMKELAARAFVILPNVTEAAALTGLPYREYPEESYLRELGDGIAELGPCPVITGIRGKDGTIGVWGKETEPFFLKTPEIPRSLHGTGDIFTAVFTGKIACGASLREAAEKAAAFTACCINATENASPDGVEFEGQLHHLWGK